MLRIENSEIERVKLEVLINEIDTARIHAGDLGEYYGNKRDKENMIRFFTTRDILHDLAENLKAAKVDTQ